MGATLTICNLTNVIINVSIGHVSPLYYENRLHPKDCFKRDVGQVWFTITAVQWSPATEFSPTRFVPPQSVSDNILIVSRSRILVRDGMKINIRGGPPRSMVYLPSGGKISGENGGQKIDNLNKKP